MTSLIEKCQALWSTPDRGATAVEYGLMVLMIATAIVGAVTLFGSTVSTLITNAADMFP